MIHKSSKPIVNYIPSSSKLKIKENQNQSRWKIRIFIFLLLLIPATILIYFNLNVHKLDNRNKLNKIFDKSKESIYVLNVKTKDNIEKWFENVINSSQILYHHNSNINIKDIQIIDNSKIDIKESLSIMKKNLPIENIHKLDTTNKIISNNNNNNNNNNNSISNNPNSIVNNNDAKLHVVTYASHGGRDDRFCRAIESAIRHDIDLVILGWGVKWMGLSQKLEAAHSFASSLPPNDAILFTDAFDVIFAEKTDNMFNKFKKMDADIVFSAECGCWPHIMEEPNTCFNKYPKSPTPYRYLNSGTWVGYANQSTKMLKEIMIEAGKNFGNANDQKLVADMYIAGRFGIKLDFYNNLFQSMHMTLDGKLPRCNPREDIRISDNGKYKNYKNYKTNSFPSIIHFNGGGKQVHLSMEKNMWYKEKKYNSIEDRIKLRNHLIKAPTQSSGNIRFEEICKGYVK
jgi:hypothetical protein